MTIHVGRIAREIDSFSIINRKLDAVSKRTHDLSLELLEYEEAYSLKASPALEKRQTLLSESKGEMGMLLAALEGICSECQKRERGIAAASGEHLYPGAAVKTIDLAYISSIIQKVCS